MSCSILVYKVHQLMQIRIHSDQSGFPSGPSLLEVSPVGSSPPFIRIYQNLKSLELHFISPLFLSFLQILLPWCWRFSSLAAAPKRQAICSIQGAQNPRENNQNSLVQSHGRTKGNTLKIR
jgi:hypothetical protein